MPTGKPALRSRVSWAAGTWLAIYLLAGSGVAVLSFSAPVFNVRNYGASGKKSEDARPAFQRALDACAAAGGGTVLVPPGEYTSGTLHLRSHVRVRLEPSATLYADQDPKAYDFGTVPSKASLFYGEDLEDVSLEGEGTVDGQAEYEWRDDDHERAFDHKDLMQRLGKPLRRSFPKGFPKREVFPHLVWLGRSKEVRITGLTFVRSPSWTIALYACERVVCDRLRVRTSLQEGVWADGIDLDGCKTVSISRCDIETGDDCVVFISTDVWGPALPCEDITVSQCRLSSASAGVKFSEGNRAGIRNVQVCDTVLSNVNRGFVFSTTLGGPISDVVLSNLNIHCRRFDWFWSGDGQPFFFRITRLSEFNREPPKPDEPPAGLIRNVLIRNVTARAFGTSRLHGHAESWLDGISLENVKLSLATDPAAPFDVADHALHVRHAKKVKLKEVEVAWEKPPLETWKTALCLEEVQSLELDSFSGRTAWPEHDTPVVLLKNVSDALIRRCQASAATPVFLRVTGPETRALRFQDNDFSRAKLPCQIGPEVKSGAVLGLESTNPKGP